MMTAADVNHYGEEGRQRMNNWLIMTEGRDEWKASSINYHSNKIL
jgi:hypothetical protein